MSYFPRISALGPLHADAWQLVDMAEIDLSVLDRQGFAERMKSIEVVQRQV